MGLAFGPELLDDLICLKLTVSNLKGNSGVFLFGSYLPMFLCPSDYKDDSF